MGAPGTPFRISLSVRHRIFHSYCTSTGSRNRICLSRTSSWDAVLVCKGQSRSLWVSITLLSSHTAFSSVDGADTGTRPRRRFFERGALGRTCSARSARCFGFINLVSAWRCACTCWERHAHRRSFSILRVACAVPSAFRLTRVASLLVMVSVSR